MLVFVDLIPFSDVFFSIWLNDIPVQMNTNILYQPSKSRNESIPFSSTSRFGHFQKQSSIFAIRILEHSLRFDRSKNNDVTFSRQQNRNFPYYVKSPSLNDDFIFYSNILPFEIQNISFNISQNFERATRQNLPRDPNVKYFLVHSTWKTIDDDLSTCWYTNRDVYPNDFFAIDFLCIKTNVIFKLAVAHSPRLQKNLDISISFDGLLWFSYRSQNGIYTKTNRTLEQHLHTYLFDSGEFNSGFKSFRYISFKAIEYSDRRFQICEVQIVSKQNITNIKRDFHRLNV